MQVDDVQQRTERLEAAYRASLRTKMLKKCNGITEKGEPIRGLVDRSRCVVCHTPRWEDGTQCRSCGSYRTQADMEDGSLS